MARRRPSGSASPFPPPPPTRGFHGSTGWCFRIGLSSVDFLPGLWGHSMSKLLHTSRSSQKRSQTFKDTSEAGSVEASDQTQRGEAALLQRRWRVGDSAADKDSPCPTVTCQPSALPLTLSSCEVLWRIQAPSPFCGSGNRGSGGRESPGGTSRALGDSDTLVGSPESAMWHLCSLQQERLVSQAPAIAGWMSDSFLPSSLPS